VKSLTAKVQESNEGVIKFHLDFREGSAPEESLLLELNVWRTRFLELGLIGQDPERYEGYGFGNLSRRLSGQRENAFIISGTQTGHLDELQADHYATVLQCSPAKNQLQATGQIKPSSEALSHGILYQSHPEIHWVMHLHSPDIFNNYQDLDLPCTDPSAAYGTPEMASAIKALAKEGEDCRPSLLVMGGHPDGILAYGSDAETTGDLVIRTLNRALQNKT
jgi:hypothetical protein